MTLTLAEIWIHPVKSLGGGRVRRAVVDDRGLRHDRRFMVVDPSGGFLTQREHPAMARVHARVADLALRLEAPGLAPLALALEVEGPRREVQVWRDRVDAIDAGDEAAGWLSEALAREVRLVRMPEDTRRRVDARYGRPGDLVSFADAFPFLVVGQGSLDALGARLEAPADVRRFRPNFVVAGAPPFAEDGWRELAIGPVRFHVKKACARCQIVDVDPDTGERAEGVLSALARFRTEERRVLFGQNLVHDGEGELAEGDPIRLA